MLGKADGSAVGNRERPCQQGRGKGKGEKEKAVVLLLDGLPGSVWFPALGRGGPAASLRVDSGRRVVSLRNQPTK